MSLNNEEGGALIEVIVAMVILALLVVGLNASVLSLVKSNIASKELSTATNKGYQLLEELRRKNYASIVADDTTINRYNLSYQVTQGDVNDSHRRIVLTVIWPVPSDRHSIVLSTIIARP